MSTILFIPERLAKNNKKYNFPVFFFKILKTIL